MTKRVPMRCQPPQERIKNFFEVALGYSESEALEEASRCLGCRKPTCIDGCPVGVNIPKFIKLLRNKVYEEALSTIKETNSLPGICGRVCPQETQCEAVCRQKEPVAIGRLERFLGDLEREGKINLQLQKMNSKNIAIAVVGSGPAGLTCAAQLALLGYKVTIFESLHEIGGVLRYGIPPFRLPRECLDFEIDYVKSLGVEIKVNMPIGLVKSIDDLFKDGFRGVFLGTGAGLPKFMDITGEQLNGVYSANEFLTRVNLMHADKFPEYHTPIVVGENVVVVGAGNVAMDSARVAKRLGAKKVCVLYRRTEAEMPARLEEYHNAKQEGIEFLWLTLPVKFHGKHQLEAVECIRMQLGEPDETGRRKPYPMENSNFIIPCETAVVAIGQDPNPLLPRYTPQLKLTKHSTIVVDENMRTSIPYVYAGGDIVTSAATVISAMGQGKLAAFTIDKDLS